jgi:osmotically inducible protein OsmC
LSVARHEERVQECALGRDRRPRGVLCPGIDEAEFQQLADTAKQTCPVSALLSTVEIGLEAKLIG